MAGRSAHRHWVSIAKWAATLVLLAVVLYKLPLGSLAARVVALDARDVAILLAVTLLQVVLAVIRWWRLLHGVGERVRFVSVFGDYCVGVLYNMLLPGGAGGDVVRSLRMRGRLEKPHAAWSTTLVERIVGLVTLGVLASVAAIVGVDTATGLPSHVRWAILGVTGLFAVGLAFASLPFQLAIRFVGKRLPEVARKDIDGIVADLGGPLKKRSVRVEAFAWSAAYHASSIVFKIACAAALGAPGHVRAILIGIPIIYVLSSVPITVGGHGLREGLYVGVLGALGMPYEVALGLDGAFILSSLLFSAIGIVFLVVDRPQATTGVGARLPPQTDT